jgi:RND family efflux transporter MFP subunit
VNDTPSLEPVALPPPAAPSRTRVTAVVVALALGFGGLFVAGWLPRRARVAAAAEASAERAGGPRRVEVARPRVASTPAALSLPGGLEPLRETAVFARASGYVRKWSADIGDRVKKGQVLCELDTPELDQELAQAEADRASKLAALEQARATVAFSESQAKRYDALAQGGIASQQDRDDKQSRARVDAATVRAAEAALRSVEANGRRLAELKSFARVTAPFDGLVTSRTVEEGTLVQAGTSGGQGLFRLAATDVVRVFVQVPQDVAPSVRPGMKAKVKVPELPGKVFEGEVKRTAGALEAATRTLRVEVHVPNPAGELLAGMFGRAELELASPHRTLLVPSSAVLVDARGTRVGVVGPEGKVRFSPVQVERDLGAEAAIVGGLEGDERLVTTPGEDIVDGAVVAPTERIAKE